MPKKDYKLFSWKFSKRFDQDISTLSIAVLVKIKNNKINDIKIAAGGVSEKPEILYGLSQLMIGETLAEGIKKGTDNLVKYVKPISDLRGTAEYRINVFKGVLRKLDISLRANKEHKSFMEII